MPLVVNGVQVDINAKNNASPVIKQVASDVQGLESTVTSTGKAGEAAFVGMGDSLMIFKTGLTGATLAISGFIAAFEFGEIAAANERIVTSGEHLAASYGESLDNIVSKVREASLSTVSDMDIITSANKAMMLGVGGNAEQLANLMEIAAFRGRAMGISTAQAFDDMARGIGRMSPMILDNLGIILDAKTTYGNYAESIGKATGELTRAEKIQALLNKVIEEGNKQLDEAGGLVEDNASKYEKFNAELENTKNFLIEDTIQMSRFADMGADLFISFRNLADNGIGYGGEKLNAFSLFMELGASRVANMNEQIAIQNTQLNTASETYRQYTDMLNITEEAQAELIIVDAAAVQGAIKVQETYTQLGEKMGELQLDHDALLAKKQALLDQGYWPENSAILSLNEKLAENEAKQRGVTDAINGTLSAMLQQTAMAGLDAEGQLALARATGAISEAAYVALSAQNALKEQYLSGALTAEQYSTKTIQLRDAINSLENADVTITANAIFNEIRNVMTNYASSGGGAQLENRYAEGTDGWMTVPAGYPNDSYPVMMQSGERFAVIPAGSNAAPASGMGSSSGVSIYLTIQSAVSVNDEQQAKNVLFPFIEAGISRLQAEGKL